MKPNPAQENDMKPRPHADLIKAWADGASIQRQHPHTNVWFDTSDPAWHPDTHYRIKPENKVYHAAINRFNGDPSSMICFSPDDTRYRHIKPHLKLVMDYEGKLISAEVI